MMQSVAVPGSEPTIDLSVRPAVAPEQITRQWYDAPRQTVKPRILCVDDESHVLDALARLLRDRYQVDTAVGGRAGVDKLMNDGPYAVVMTDMRMPDVDGVALLGIAREKVPGTTRILLTGQTELQAAIAAVNDGNIFRFLLKPCPPDLMRKALDAAVEQEALLRTEKDLLQDTLKGALKLCMDVLALVHPQALSRAARVRRVAGLLTDAIPGADHWSVEIAALLAHVGGITLPPQVLEKLHTGATLTLGEIKQVERLPTLGAQLVSAIPRLEPVRDILQFQRTWFDGSHSPVRGVAGEQIPIGARILMLADDYDVLASRDMSIASRLRVLESRKGAYDPQLLEALRTALTAPSQSSPTDEGSVLRLEQVRLGLIFAEDVVGPNGLILIGRGQEVTVALLERIQLLSTPYRTRLVKMLPGKSPA